MRAPSEFGRVCVLMGGMAAEREISLKSGIAVLDALKSVGIDAEGLDWGEGFELFELQRFDRIFIAVHGRGGEDGRLQGALDMLRLPYTGSGFAASALAMDKIRAKQVWQSCDIPTPHFAVARSDREPDSRLLKSLGLPLMVKPNREGSSLGATRVEDRSELPAAIETALGFDTDVLIEPWISGVEYTLGVVGRRALPLIKLETPRDFYDYEAKYFSNTTRYICPAGLSEDRERALAKISMDAFDALGCSGWGRVDLFVDDNGKPWILEVNTVPGMTDHSLVPMAAREVGMDFAQLVTAILELSASGESVEVAA